MNETGTKQSLWIIIFLLAAGIRAGVLYVDFTHSHHLSEDRDAYLDISHQLATGHGFSLSSSGKPTAFRPPLYPLLLAGIEVSGAGLYGIALLHFVLSTLTVYFTYRLSRKFLPEKFAIGVMALIAVDPLLLQYTSLVMTETLFVFLFTVLIDQVVPDKKNGPSSEPVSYLKSFTTGVLFGLCALCRPTIWAFGILWLLSHLVSFILKRNQNRSGTFFSIPLITGIILVVSPWMIRNVIQFNKPVFTTTHGGYTLLLGNNSVFYDEVVSQKWGTVWSYESLKNWQDSLESEMANQPEPVKTETERDQWMYQKAFEEIRNNPNSFLSACLLRLGRFWNITPTGPSAGGVSQQIRFGIGIYYALILTGMVIGILSLKKSEWSNWVPIILSLLAFSVVHLFFWTNMRMRAPLLPLICILAMRGFMACRKKREE